MRTPARVIKVGNRGIVSVVSLRDGESVMTESGLERDWILQLDFDPDVSDIISQPFTLSYTDSKGKRRRYTPDISAMVRDDLGTVERVIYEVKPVRLLRLKEAEYADAFDAARRYCAEHGWRFAIVTEEDIDPVRIKNIQFLRRYRWQETNEEHARSLAAALQEHGPQSAADLIHVAFPAPEDALPVLASLWHLVSIGRLAVDLDRQMTNLTVVSLP